MQRLEGGMVDVIDVEIDVDGGAGRKRGELEVELGDAGEGERAADGDLPDVALLALRDLDAREPADRVEDGNGHAEAHAGEEVEAGHADDGRPVNADLMVDGELADVVQVDEVDADVDEQAGQHREGDALDQGAQEKHAEQDPDAVEDGRPAGNPAGGDVGRGSHDDAGDGQAAEQAGDEVAGALGGELLVEVRAGTAVELVGGDGAEQRLDAGDDGQGEDRDEEGAPLGRQLELGEGERLREVDALDVHLRHERDGGAEDDGHQRAGNGAHGGPGKLLPDDEHRDGQHAEDGGVQVQGAQTGRQRDQVGQG